MSCRLGSPPSLIANSNWYILRTKQGLHRKWRRGGRHLGPEFVIAFSIITDRKWIPLDANIKCCRVSKIPDFAGNTPPPLNPNPVRTLWQMPRNHLRPATPKSKKRSHPEMVLVCVRLMISISTMGLLNKLLARVHPALHNHQPHCRTVLQPFELR